jgi:hypothetical protein
MSEGIKQVSLRIPDELHTVLVQIAEQERRSLHAQILVMLEAQAKALQKPAQK